MTELTPKQKEILEVLIKFINAGGVAPSVSELMSMCGYQSKNPIHRQLHILKDLGYVKIKPHVSRGLRLTEKAKAL